MAVIKKVVKDSSLLITSSYTYYLYICILFSFYVL